MFTLLRYGPVLAPAISFSALHGSVHAQMCLVSALVLMYTTEKTLKHLLHSRRFARPSPCTPKVFSDRTVHDACGFPSGHTAHAMMCALVVYSFQDCSITVPALLVFLSAYERVQTGCHNIEQCAAGGVLGLLAFAVFLSVL
jgi:membrane-associated phospholipid phosphatase